MIVSFKDTNTKQIFERIFVNKFSKDINKRAYRKLLMLDAANKLDDLLIPPGNRLKKMKGINLYSIRVNKQWRICFKWKDKNAYEVHLIDYHK